MASLHHRMLFISLICLFGVFSALNAFASINVVFNSPSDGNSFIYGYPIDFSATVNVTASQPPNQVGVVNYSWDSNVDGQLSTATTFTKNDLNVGSHLIALTTTHYENKSLGFAVRAIGTDSWNSITYATETYKAKGKCHYAGKIAAGVIGGAFLGYIVEGIITGQSVGWTGPIIGAGVGGIIGYTSEKKNCSDETKTRTVPVSIPGTGTVTADSGAYNYFVNATDGNKFFGTFRPSLSSPNAGVISNIKYYLINITMPDGNVDVGPVTLIDDGVNKIWINEDTGDVYASSSSGEALAAGLTTNIVPQVHDVEVSSLSMPIDSVINNLVSVSATVRNNGNMPESITVRFRVDGNELASDSFTLTAGQSINSGTIPFDALGFTPTTASSKAVNVGIDAVAGDVNPGNDSLSQATNVMNYNQAITLNLSTSSPIYSNNSFVLTAAVTNNSDVNLDVPLVISLPSGLSLDAGETADKNLVGLLPGSSQVTWSILTTTSGVYPVNVSAFSGAVNQPINITVVSTYNRVLDSAVYPTGYGINTLVDFNVTVRNAGAKPDSFTVSLITDGGVQDSAFVSLNGGQSSQLILNYTYTAAGVYDVNIVIDFNSEEASLTDNYSEGSITVVDVSALALDVSNPASVFNLTKFTVSAYVWNNGVVDVNNVGLTISLAPGLILSAGETATKTIPGIAPGSYGLVQWDVNSTMLPGTLDINVSAYSGLLSDSNSVNVTMNQNRKINSLIVPVPSINDNTLTFVVEVENAGNFDESFIVRFYVDGVEKDSAVVNLSPASLQNINFLYLFALAGTYDINVNADVNINELTLNDNNAYAQLTVIDINAPKTTADYAGEWRKSPFVITLTCVDGSGCQSTEYMVDIDPSNAVVMPGTWSSGTSISISADGNWAVDFNSTDTNGNIEATNRVYALLDQTAPSSASLSALPAYSQSTLVDLNWSSNPAIDLLSGIAYYNVWRTLASVVSLIASFITDLNYSDLVPIDGNYGYFVQAVDNAGNDANSATAYTVIDSAGPAFSNYYPVNASTIGETLPATSIDYSDTLSGINASTARIWVDSVEQTAFATITSSSISFTPSTDLNSGRHDVNVWVNDNAGNQAVTSWYFNVSTVVVRDFRVKSISSPAGVLFGNNVNVDANILNEGTVYGTAVVKFFVNEVDQGQDINVSLDLGASSLLTFTWNANQAGVNVLKVAVIPLSGETDVADNNAERNIDVNTIQDTNVLNILSIESIVLDRQSTIYLGDEILVKAKIKNEGTSSENVSVLLQVYDSVNGWNILDSSLESIASGQEKDVSLSFDANNADYQIVRVYASPLPGETDLTDNQLDESIRVWSVASFVGNRWFNQTLYPAQDENAGQDFYVADWIDNLAQNVEDFKDIYMELDINGAYTITSSRLGGTDKNYSIDVNWGSSDYYYWTVRINTPGSYEARIKIGRYANDQNVISRVFNVN